MSFFAHSALPQTMHGCGRDTFFCNCPQQFRPACPACDDRIHPVTGQDPVDQYCRLQKRGVKHHETSESSIECLCSICSSATLFRFPGVAQHQVKFHITPDLSGWHSDEGSKKIKFRFQKYILVCDTHESYYCQAYFVFIVCMEKNERFGTMITANKEARKSE